MTVLAVDDEPEILAALGIFLGETMPDLTLLTAESALAALAILKKRKVDVLISDHRMPGMSGLDLLRQARTLDPLMGRILITAYPDLDLAMKALNEARIDRFVTKPIEPRSFRDTLRAVLRERDTRE